MHLSLFSDAYLSDVLDDAGTGTGPTGVRAPAQAYREALLRGLAAIAIAGTLLGLTFLSSAVRSAEIGQTAAPMPTSLVQAKISARIEPGE